MVNKLGMNYFDAEKAVDRDFEDFENEGIAPTKG